MQQCFGQAANEIKKKKETGDSQGIAAISKCVVIKVCESPGSYTREGILTEQSF